MSGKRHQVALFVTCLVDLFRPRVGFAAVKLLEDAGCRVEVPGVQTCCGQPGYNSGDRASARRVARRVVAAFAGYDYVVAPSGSCAAMIKEHYPSLFADEGSLADEARGLASRTWELVSFLVEVCGVRRVDARFDGVITYHDSCSALRELGVRDQPRRLLESVRGLTLTELADSEVCCGFGGTFCVKYPEISTRMVAEKAARVVASGSGTVVGGDLGCLLNIAGRLTREGAAMRVCHVAEVLAGMAEDAAIGEPG